MTDLTLTVLDAADLGSAVVEHSNDGATWQKAATTHREPLPANRTTPFQFTEPMTARYWRVRAHTPLRLRQLELFEL